MFGGRLLMNMACKAAFRPTFKVTKSYASMTPVFMYLNYKTDKLQLF